MRPKPPCYLEGVIFELKRMNHDQTLKNMTTGSLIRVLREIAMLGVLGYLSVKLFSGEMSIDFTKLSATELVNLLLAFFSIALSAAFYFAATSQSNQFYDNVNKFSKDTSELLGRVDEQVKGLGGRQSELKDSIDKYYLMGNGKSREPVSEEKNNVVAKVKKVEGDLSKLVAELLDKANMSGPERVAFEAQLKARDSELSELREKIGRIANRSDAQVQNFLRRKIERRGLENAINAAPDELLMEFANEGPSAFRRDLLSLGYILSETIDSPADVSESGRQLVSTVVEKLIDQNTSGS